MVISTPTIRDIIAIMGMFRDFVRFEPICVPIRVIDSSAPSEKSPSPTISRQVPTMKAMKISFGNGHTVNDKRRTMSAIGRTERQASFTFSIMVSNFCRFIYVNFLNINNIYLLYYEGLCLSMRMRGFNDKLMLAYK